MAGTRRSARVASQQSSSPASSQSAPPAKATPAKRRSEAGTSPVAKRGKKASEPEQKTLEETIDRAPAGDDDNIGPEPMQEEKPSTTSDDATKASEHKSDEVPQQEPEAMEVDEKETEKPATNGETQKPDEHGTEARETVEEAKQEPVKETNHQQPTMIEPEPKQDVTAAADNQQPAMTEDEPKQELAKAAEDTPPPTEEHKHEPVPPASLGNTESAVEPNGRDKEPPSSILEKGLIYFLFRGRVGIDDPSQVDDIARSYMVMRPLPKDAKLGDGPIGDDGNCRLLALPKKVLPLSGKDKFLSFVEKAKTSFKDIKDNALSSSDYVTQTAGTRHTPAMTPVAEGVYAITSTGRESHLAYVVTIPSELSEVQKDVGIRERGSFVVSAKNPQQPSPANASLPQGPDYPQEILDEFRSLRWMPLQPKLLDYVNTQFLLIGESGGIDNALQTQKEDEGKDRETPHEEMEKLEGEDEIRVRHLQGDDAIFADLGLSSKEFSKVPSTW